MVGAFLAAYGVALHSTAVGIGNQVNTYVNVAGVSPDPTFIEAVLAQIASYAQQNVTPVWTYYLALGIAMVVCGAVLVVVGDRKPAKAGEQAPPQSQPFPTKRQK